MKNQNPSGNRTRTLVSLGICGLALIGAAIVGVDDNPPGLGLAYVAAICFVIAFVHPWRSTKQFGWLILASLLGFVLFAFLHNFLEVIAFNMATGVVRVVLEGVSTAAFLIAVMISPAVFVTGIFGVVVLVGSKLIHRKQR